MIGFEAGHGDMIFYVRYIAQLKQRGVSRIALICHPGLVELFKTLAGVDQLFSWNDVVPQSGWDYWSPPMSLPYYCQSVPDTFPCAIPYLHAQPDKVVLWQLRLSEIAAHKLKVGLVWRGSSLFENDADRSITELKTLLPLAAISEVHYISLQKGQGEAEAQDPPAGWNLLALGPQLDDFAETAAVIANLDLVISVDTAVAHLAGAMGIPCWVLLPDYRTDWRWLTDSADSLWYPQQMRLMRQTPGGGWPELIAKVAAELQSWCRDSAIGHN